MTFYYYSNHVLLEIYKLQTLDNIIKNSQRLRKIYTYYDNDFYIIIKVLGLKLPYNTCEFFLKSYQKNLH